MMRQPSRRRSPAGGRWATTTVLVIALVGAAALTASAAASPGGGVTRSVWGSTEPVNAPGQDLTVSRVMIPPRASLAPHFHEGTQFARVTAGTLTYHILSGTAVLTTAAGVTSTPSAPAVIKLRRGDTLVENPALEHWAENRGRIPVVIELSSLLRDGAPASTPLGDGAAASMHISVDLTSTGTVLHTVNTSTLYGWNHLVGAGSDGSTPVDVEMQGNVSYTNGAGGFGGFVTFTFGDGSTLGTRMEGSATKQGDATDFAATMVILGGTGRFLDSTGSGTFTGSRSGAIGSPVASDFDLYLR